MRIYDSRSHQVLALLDELHGAVVAYYVTFRHHGSDPHGALHAVDELPSGPEVVSYRRDGASVDDDLVHPVQRGRLVEKYNSPLGDQGETGTLSELFVRKVPYEFDIMVESGTHVPGRCYLHLPALAPAYGAGVRLKHKHLACVAPSEVVPAQSDRCHVTLYVANIDKIYPLTDAGKPAITYI